MHLVRLFLVLMATRVVLEKISEDYDWFLRYLQQFEPERLETIPEGIKNFLNIILFLCYFSFFREKKVIKTNSNNNYNFDYDYHR